MPFQMFSKYYIFQEDLEIVWFFFYEEKHEKEDW